MTMMSPLMMTGKFNHAFSRHNALVMATWLSFGIHDLALNHDRASPQIHARALPLLGLQCARPARPQSMLLAPSR